MKNKLYIFGIIGIILISSLFIYNTNKSTKLPTKNEDPKEKIGEKSAKPDINNTVPEVKMISKKHPYGNIVLGSLMWENNQQFIKLCKELNIEKRMAAFETILPDPLPGEESNVARAADLLTNTVIRPGEVFSLNKKIGPFSPEKGYKKGPAYRGNQIIQSIGGGVCKIASTLYNVVIYANLPIIERYPHSMLVPYVPPGQDATISYTGNKDFKFVNNTAKPVLIWADTKGSTLYIAIYGSTEPPQVIWKHEELNRVRHLTEYRFNPKLASGQEKVLIPGADGLTIKSWLEIKRTNGEVEIKELGIDRYEPMTRVLEKGKT